MLRPGLSARSAKRDAITLAEARQNNLCLVLECLGCGHKRRVDVDGLLHRFRPEMTMKQLAGRARCKNYGCRGQSGAEVLLRTGDYKDDWWPRVPIIRGR